MDNLEFEKLLPQCLCSFTLVDGTVVEGETASNIRHVLVSCLKIRNLPPIGTTFGCMLERCNMKMGKGKRDDYGKQIAIYYMVK